VQILICDRYRYKLALDTELKMTKLALDTELKMAVTDGSFLLVVSVLNTAPRIMVARRILSRGCQ